MQWSNQTRGSMNDEPRIKTDHTNGALRLSTGFDSDRLVPRSGRHVDLIRIQPGPTCLILFWFQRSSKTQLGRQRGRWEIWAVELPSKPLEMPCLLQTEGKVSRVWKKRKQTKVSREPRAYMKVSLAILCRYKSGSQFNYFAKPPPAINLRSERYQQDWGFFDLLLHSIKCSAIQIASACNYMLKCSLLSLEQWRPWLQESVEFLPRQKQGLLSITHMIHYRDAISSWLCP